MGTGRTYTLEFQKQVIELAARLESVSKAADQLGIPKINIRTWKKKSGEQKGAESRVTVFSLEQEEIKRLRKEVSELKQANLILKTAAAFFSQDHLKKSMS